MTQTLAPSPSPSLAWCQAFQVKLMAALDAAWAILEHSDDPADIKRARDKAKACGDLAAMVRKVALIMPTPRAAKPAASPPAWEAPLETTLAPLAAQTEHARRALDKLKGGRRGRP